MKEMSVIAVVRHDLDPELVPYLEKLQLSSQLKICGPEVMLSVSDIEELPADIRKVAREVAKINRLLETVKYPWVAKEVLDGRAVLIAGKLVYPQNRPPQTLRQKLEVVTGHMDDETFASIMDYTTEYIKDRMLKQGIGATLDEVIKIAAERLQTLRTAQTKMFNAIIYHK